MNLIARSLCITLLFSGPSLGLAADANPVEKLNASADFQMLCMEQTNSTQCALATRTLRPRLTPSSAFSLCEALEDAAHELRESTQTPLGLDHPLSCTKENFPYSILRFRQTISGEVFGSGFSALTYDPVTTKAVFERINAAIEDGRVVLLTVITKKLQPGKTSQTENAALDEWADTAAPSAGSRTIVIRSQLRNSTGAITHYVVMDALAPQKLYLAESAALQLAYQSVPAKSRGSFITNASRLDPNTSSNIAHHTSRTH